MTAPARAQQQHRAPAGGGQPRRALIVSAAIGEGHNAAGRALAEAIGRAWPGCEAGWLDALAAVGPGFAPLARRFYTMQVRRTPRMYEFFFTSMWRHHRYLEAVRHGAGALFGRRMFPHIRAFAPDAVLSTYPLASAGLSWLRGHGLLAARAAAWIPAFCPHPSWLYPSLDITYVVHPAARDAALRAEPGMRVAVGALPVRDAFGPGDQRFARQRLGLATDRFTTAVATGSFGLGQVSALVTALLAAGPQVQVIVVCGRNEQLRARLAAHREPGRLHLLGWTDDMPAVMTAADVVVTNGGGGTALEAVASGRPVVMADPVAGHGRANATLMAEAGLALLAPSPAALTATVRGLARDPVTAVSRARANLAALAGRQREDDLAEFAALPPP